MPPIRPIKPNAVPNAQSAAGPAMLKQPANKVTAAGPQGGSIKPPPTAPNLTMAPPGPPNLAPGPFNALGVQQASPSPGKAPMLPTGSFNVPSSQQMDYTKSPGMTPYGPSGGVQDYGGPGSTTWNPNMDIGGGNRTSRPEGWSPPAKEYGPLTDAQLAQLPQGATAGPPQLDSEAKRRMDIALEQPDIYRQIYGDEPPPGTMFGQGPNAGADVPMSFGMGGPPQAIGGTAQADASPSPLPSPHRLNNLPGEGPPPQGGLGMPGKLPVPETAQNAGAIDQSMPFNQRTDVGVGLGDRNPDPRQAMLDQLSAPGVSVPDSFRDMMESGGAAGGSPGSPYYGNPQANNFYGDLEQKLQMETKLGLQPGSMINPTGNKPPDYVPPGTAQQPETMSAQQLAQIRAQQPRPETPPPKPLGNFVGQGNPNPFDPVTGPRPGTDVPLPGGTQPPFSPVNGGDRPPIGITAAPNAPPPGGTPTLTGFDNNSATISMTSPGGRGAPPPGVFGMLGGQQYPDGTTWGPPDLTDPLNDPGGYLDPSGTIGDSGLNPGDPGYVPGGGDGQPGGWTIPPGGGPTPPPPPGGPQSPGSAPPTSGPPVPGGGPITAPGLDPPQTPSFDPPGNEGIGGGMPDRPTGTTGGPTEGPLGGLDPTTPVGPKGGDSTIPKIPQIPPPILEPDPGGNQPGGGNQPTGTSGGGPGGGIVPIPTGSPGGTQPSSGSMGGTQTQKQDQNQEAKVQDLLNNFLAGGINIDIDNSSGAAAGIDQLLDIMANAEPDPQFIQGSRGESFSSSDGYNLNESNSQNSAENASQSSGASQSQSKAQNTSEAEGQSTSQSNVLHTLGSLDEAKGLIDQIGREGAPQSAYNFEDFQKNLNNTLAGVDAQTQSRINRAKDIIGAQGYDTNSPMAASMIDDIVREGFGEQNRLRAQMPIDFAGVENPFNQQNFAGNISQRGQDVSQNAQIQGIIQSLLGQQESQSQATNQSQAQGTSDAAAVAANQANSYGYSQGTSNSQGIGQNWSDSYSWWEPWGKVL